MPFSFDETKKNLGNSPANRRRLSEIDGLRALAISLVVLFHYTKEFFPGHRFFSFGWSGVDLFFVISGFVLYLRVKQKYSVGGKVSYRKYLRNRTLRIVPAYYVSLVVMVLLFGRDKLFSKTFLLHLSFLHIFDSDVAMSIQPLYWTLAVEVQFYLFLILAAPLLTGESGMRWLLGLVAGNILYRLLIFPFFYSASSHTGLMLGNILPGRIGEFAYGMIIAKMFIERVSWIEYLKRPLIMGVTALMTVILVSGCWIVWLKMGDAFLDWWLTNALLYPAVGLGYGLLFVLVLTSPLMNRIMSMRCIVFTGTISYSIYLWHVFSLKIADNILTGTGGFLVSLITTLIISTFSYYFIEKTFLRLKAR